MRKRALRPQLLLYVLLGGVLTTAGVTGGSAPAAAFGMFGVGRPMMGRPMMGRPMMGRPMMGPGAWRRMPGPGPRPGAGRVVGRHPIDGGGTRISRGEGWPSRHHPITAVSPVGGGIAGRGTAPGPGGTGSGPINIPPRNETRLVRDEIITAFAAGTTPQAISRVARRYDLTRLESQIFPLIGTTLYRWRIGGRGSAAGVLRELSGEHVIASAQPNYVYRLEQDAALNPAPAALGDPAQYVLSELQIAQAQQIATGKDITVAVIDSEIDSKHRDLGDAIVKNFDAITGDPTPHSHGTSIAGAIASHGKLLGIAPGVQLLAVHAFAGPPGEATGTSYAISKGVQWATDNGARVINMSFAGPPDPVLQHILTEAYDKGVVLIAAAGNAGPQSEPLYPAADPDVIAVTATDDNDKLFKMANRGRYIAVSAPGVDILALAPGDTYQITTGTSIAAAHVSGIAAMLLQCKPSLKPGDVRAVLTTTAKPLGPPTPDSDFGAGLVDAYRAVTWVGGKPPAPAISDAEAKQ
jgi:subtilisin family serine protease